MGTDFSCANQLINLYFVSSKETHMTWPKCIVKIIEKEKYKTLQNFFV